MGCAVTFRTAAAAAWEGKAGQQQGGGVNWRGQGNYGKRSLKRRGELVERSFAHCYDTWRQRWRTYLRSMNNILKRQLIHTGFNRA